MTREEAIKLLTQYIDYDAETPDYYEMEKACKVAIKALEQEPCCNCIEFKRYAKEMGFEIEQEPILDKIRAEIDEEADYAYADFDRYKEDILHAESDELPDDDFRYGLRRAIEIIDKYKAESEK